MSAPDDVRIEFEDGNKDEYRVTVELKEDGNSIRWAPTNEEFFKMLEMWFEAEDNGFGDGYGSMWTLFFIAMTQHDSRLHALENNQRAARRQSPKAHFLRTVDEHGDEIVDNFENLVEEAREELEGWDDAS